MIKLENGWILVKLLPDDGVELKTDSGIYIVSEQPKNYQISCGVDIRYDEVVYFNKRDGSLALIQGQEFLVLRESDIIARIVPDNNG